MNKWFFYMPIAATLLSSPLSSQALIDTDQHAVDSPILSVFPETAEEIDAAFELATNEALAGIQQILSIPSGERTFENTVREFDRIAARFYTPWCAVTTLQMVHPDPILRSKAEKVRIAYKEFAIIHFDLNRAIYQAFKEYQNGNGHKEILNAERAYFLTNALTTFHQLGLDLSVESYEQMKSLSKEIALLEGQFSTNIALDRSSLTVTRDALAGMSEDFIAGLQKEGDRYILNCDYPTRAEVLEDCTIASTRRDYYRSFYNRASPHNLVLLGQLVSKRDELAQLLGYESYAAFDIQPQMAKDPAVVAKFLENSLAEALPRASHEWSQLCLDLPESVMLTPEGKINPWDAEYLSKIYKQKHFSLDSNEIASYFPLETTILGMLSVFGEFLGLQFKIIPCSSLWDPSVQVIEVRDPHNEQPLLGYLLLDLFPRANKYSHACCNNIVLPMSDDEGLTYQPSLAIIITNFSKPTASKPALLYYGEVTTLFHEFGHAMHAFLGRAEMPRKGAYNTTIDFIETPSQFFEEWLADAKILKRVSSHHQTKEPLSDALIQNLLAAKEFAEGRRVAQELCLSKISLNCFLAGSQEDLVAIEKKAHEQTLPGISHDPESQMLCSFNHLVGYGAMYYSYLWSKQLAVKLYAYVRTHGGPLDPAMGKRYREKVIGKGGSCHPQLLVDDFLSE